MKTPQARAYRKELFGSITNQKPFKEMKIEMFFLACSLHEFSLQKTLSSLASEP